MSNMTSGSLSLEAFNHLDHFYSGLIPQTELSTDSNAHYIWVCKYAGMDFYRPMTIGEVMNSALRDMSNLN